jgi:hypothetical protein
MSTAVSPAVVVLSEFFETAESIAKRFRVEPSTIFEWARRKTNPLPVRRITHKHMLFVWSECKAWADAGGTLRAKTPAWKQTA